MAASTVPMGMFLQDPAISDIFEDYDFPLSIDFLDGMSSSRFIVRDMDDKGVPVFSGLDWRVADDLSFQYFNKRGAIDSPQFHQVNGFAVASHTLDFVEAELGHHIIWQGGGPLLIRPHAFNGLNAYYDPSAPSLNFGYATSPFRRAPVWTVLSHDVVSHELGHAILDNVRPMFSFSGNKDTAALHESFGDLIAMFSALEHPAVVSRLYSETNGDLYSPNLVASSAEELGIALFGSSTPYLRSALIGPEYGSLPIEAHERSTIWTAAIYELLARLVDLQKPKSKGEFLAAIGEASRWVRGMMLRAVNYTSPAAVSMPQLARIIYEADARVFPADAKFRDIAKAVFEGRKLWDPNLTFAAPDIGHELKDVAPDDVVSLSKIIMRHAEELYVPLGAGVRLLTPSLVTTTRTVDHATDARGNQQTMSITEHYLSYVTELVVAKQLEAGLQLIYTYHGGTLALDDQWKAGMLVLDVERMKADDDGEKGLWQAAQREIAKFESMRRQTGCMFDNGSRGRHECPYEVQTTTSGPARLVLRRCNLERHLRGVSGSHSTLPFASRSFPAGIVPPL